MIPARWIRGVLAIGLVLAGARPACAEPDMAPMLVALAGQDRRVAIVAFRLLTAGAALCAEKMPASGLVLHDLQQYAPAARPAAVRAFGFAGHPAVLAVVPGSPAEQAGIRETDAILSIDGVPVADATPRAKRRASYDAMSAVDAQLAAALSRGSVALGIGRGGAVRTARLDPVAACRSRVQLEPGSRFNAWSDGRSVALTTAVTEAAASDDELAALIGHEIAHNILGHRERLRRDGIGAGLFSRIGANARKVQQTEMEADYWGLYLAARAGYDPAAAAAFWRRFGAAHGDGLFTDATHPGWRRREQALVRAAAEIAARRAQGIALVPDAIVP